MKQYCGNDSSPQCQPSLEQALNPRAVGLQARYVATISTIVRGVGRWIIPVLAAWIAFVTKALFLPEIDHLHIPESDIALVSSYASSSTLVMATAGGDPNKVTLTQSVTSTTMTGLVLNIHTPILCKAFSEQS